MEFENSFEVPLPPAAAWKILLDVERLVPCMPGAELTEILGEDGFKGNVKVRLGPVALTFSGTAKFEQVDEENRTATVRARGNDVKGRGGAQALVKFALEPSDAGSTVKVHTDLALSGTVAQYGRGTGVIREMADQLIGEFARSLNAQLVAERPEVTGAAAAGTAEAAAPAPPRQAKPVSGFALLARALWRTVKGWFGPSHGRV